MFTGNQIDLATAARNTSMEVVRDCSISYVGKVPTALPRRFVPCGLPAHIEAAASFDDIAGIVTTAEYADLVPKHMGLAVAEKPVVASLQLHEALCAMDGFLWEHFETRIHPDAIVHPTAIIADRDVEIGAHAVIHPGAIVMERVLIGAHCAIGPGTVVGTDAFEVNIHENPHRVLKQAGGVRLANHVEIQAKCTIVRATFGGFTEIGRESKFDCQVHLAHDCVVGERVRFAACAEISGRVTIGDDVFIGPNCSISNGVKIGEKSHVTIGAVVVQDIPDNGHVSGNFAVEHKKLIAHIKAIR